MGEKDNFNPSFVGDMEPNGYGEGRPSGLIVESIGPGVNVMRDAKGEIIGLYDDLGRPIAQ